VERSATPYSAEAGEAKDIRETEKAIMIRIIEMIILSKDFSLYNN